jgi:hypothetical protein
MNLDLDSYLLGVQHAESLGYERGYAEGDRDGYERGVQQRQFDLAAGDTAYRVDRDLAPLPPRSQLARRRREFRGITGEPARPQTPEQIRARAEASWRRVEREITAAQQDRRSA